MKKLKIALVSLLLANVSINACAVEPEYTSNSKVLTIPIVKIGDGFVYDATLKLNDAGSFDIIGYSKTPADSGVNAKCTEDNITLEKYKQITDEMTLEQVTSVIGCKGELTTVSERFGEFYKWTVKTLPSIGIAFQNNAIVGKTYLP